MPEQEPVGQSLFNPIEVGNRKIKPLALTRKIGEGVFIQNFGTIRVVDRGIEYLYLSIKGIGENTTSMPAEDHRLKWDRLYTFGNKEYYIVVQANPYAYASARILLDIPKDVEIVREEELLFPVEPENYGEAN